MTAEKEMGKFASCNDLYATWAGMGVLVWLYMLAL
jgi:hypothetical protein